jgi:hypothetical protein
LSRRSNLIVNDPYRNGIASLRSQRHLHKSFTLPLIHWGIICLTLSLAVAFDRAAAPSPIKGEGEKIPKNLPSPRGRGFRGGGKPEIDNSLFNIVDCRLHIPYINRPGGTSRE